MFQTDKKKKSWVMPVWDIKSKIWEKRGSSRPETTEASDPWWVYAMHPQQIYKLPLSSTCLNKFAQAEYYYLRLYGERNMALHNSRAGCF